MKILWGFVFVVIFLFISNYPVSAHMIGQPPYFKVNGVFSDYYPVPTTSVSDFELPQDIASGVFLVNEAIEFEIDVQALPIPEEVVGKTRFIWDFGDGSSAEGLKNSHAFTKPGTYFVDIKADSGEGFEPQLLQSTAINILPDKDYRIAKAVIEVNGKRVKDPLLDLIEVDFNKDIRFDGSKSDKGSSEIIEYVWDLGDQTSKHDQRISYKYSENPYTVFPVLRIKTRDGFVADAFVQIKDESAFDESSLTGESGFDFKMIVLAVLFSAAAAALLTWVISKFLFKKNKSAP